jgi:hypothetical protein
MNDRDYAEMLQRLNAALAPSDQRLLRLLIAHHNASSTEPRAKSRPIAKRTQAGL